MVNIILNNRDRLGDPRKVQSAEEKMSWKIRTGNLTDSDIDKVVKEGGSLKRQLDERLNHQLKEKKHINNIHGELYDFKDNKGRLCKEYDAPMNVFNK